MGQITAHDLKDQLIAESLKGLFAECEHCPAEVNAGILWAKVAELEGDNVDLVEQVARVQDGYVKLDSDHRDVIALYNGILAKVAEQAATIERLNEVLDKTKDDLEENVSSRALARLREVLSKK